MKEPTKEITQLPDSTAERVLLINPPVYDTRLHWAQWQQPTYLLRLASFFRPLNTEIRLIDALYVEASSRVTRKRVNIVQVDTEAVPRWRFGLEQGAIRSQFKRWKEEGWCPDDVYIEAFATIWWQGAAEVAELVKEFFPNARVIMIGGYPAQTPQHAKGHGADITVPELWPEVAALPADPSIYPKPPSFLYLSTSQGRRTVEEVVREIISHISRGVRQFAFVDHEIARRHPELFSKVLEHLATHRVDAKLAAIGNVAPSDMAEQAGLAALMRRAGYSQIFFADDRDAPNDDRAGEQLVEDYRIAAEYCRTAGFPERTGDICASISVGRPHETIAERAKVATLASHFAGSVILWPYQPSPEQCPELPLELANGKLFPFRAQNGYSYRDYLNLMGLGVVLNSKYRSETFDFLGDGFVARLLRDSIARQGWNPDPSVKGSLRILPVQRN